MSNEIHIQSINKLTLMNAQSTLHFNRGWFTLESTLYVMHGEQFIAISFRGGHVTFVNCCLVVE